MSKKHGGSRPVKRTDDGRLKTKPGYEKLVKMRFLNTTEEEALKKFTPRQRVEILLLTEVAK